MGRCGHKATEKDCDSSLQDKFCFERSLFLKGIYPIAGIDEAGRGPLAGPVVAGAVIFPGEWYSKGLPRELSGLNDSKQLSPKKRDYFYECLTSSPDIKWACAIVEPAEIDSLNILNATYRAFITAIEKLPVKPAYVLVDGNPVKPILIPQTAIIKGDSLSYSIAAASVIAKVTRDRIMIELDKKYPDYGFAVHKGYATRQHLEALKIFGPSPIHRKSFAPVNNYQLKFLE